MALPINRRDFDLFISHSHSDAGFALDLQRWLEKAGLRGWLDVQQFSAGSFLATGLQAAIGRCRGALLIATPEALAKGWVVAEYNAAMDERANFPEFRVIALRVARADVGNLMRGITWIDIPEARLNAAAAEALLGALYPSDNRPNPATARDVYVSCSWRESDVPITRAICGALVKQGFRLIGDALDQKTWDAERIARLIASCGALVAIIPYRDDTAASAETGPYRYFLREIDVARRLGTPVLVVADSRIRADAGVSDQAWIRVPLEGNCATAQAEAALRDLWEDWQEPSQPAFAFLAIDLQSSQTAVIRRLVERVAGLTVQVGTDVPGPNLETAIMQRLGSATVVLGDLTDDNVNVCIEVGMAIALGRRVEIFARGDSRRPPFMLRSLQMPTYRDEVELLAVVHKLVRLYRRRVINAEL